MKVINKMLGAATKAQIGYMQSGEPTPHLEFVMHPSALAALQYEADRDGCRLLNRRVHDGRFEFMNHVVREDSGQDGWKLQPVTQ